jgi:hypothetical protein
MKRISIYVFTIVLACAVTAMFARVAAHHSLAAGSAVHNPVDAAFRDGLFQGRLDAQRGRKQHLASGRWNRDADRRLFVSGYLQAYRDTSRQGSSEQPAVWRPAEQRGYRDGMTDGLQQLRQSKHFDPDTTPNYKNAGRGYSDSSDGLNQYRRVYREAYCTGYQVGYYGQPESLETAEFIRAGELE